MDVGDKHRENFRKEILVRIKNYMNVIFVRVFHH